MSDFNQLLEEQLLMTLEAQAFLFADPAPSEDEPWNQESESDEKRCSLGFEGPMNGVFHLSMPDGLIREVAENLLEFDEDEPLDEGIAGDVVYEILNVLAGRLLSEISPEGSALKLSPHGAKRDAKDGEPTNRSQYAATVSVDDYCVWALLEVNR